MGSIVYCYNCATPNPRGALVCSRCGGAHLTANAARPIRVFPSEGTALPYPWAGVLTRWPAGKVIGLYGSPGCGKSSLAALLRPQAWLTTEQTVDAAAETLVYVQRENYEAPEMRALDGPELGPYLGGLYTGLVVLDSVTKCGGLREQLHALEQLVAWAADGTDRRGLAIFQVNKEGEPAGLKENEHLTHANVAVAQEESGLRRVFAVKNRSGPYGSQYFTLGANGLETPRFLYSYSVEGTHGTYRLEPWPSPRASWAGVLDLVFERGARPGLAHAGRPVPGYPDGMLLPADWEHRKAFAEAHGLHWLEVKVEDLVKGEDNGRRTDDRRVPERPGRGRREGHPAKAG